ncbi:MAG: tRNA lysidine(34) synthetase TilS, partial [Chloroflexi bacterium]|nr:tRNA lysidine(34) synthetase TilS [Chloroflexota bacterium]
VALAHQAAAVAVGHHADDQVETILMHFLRGAGLSGLRGMQPASALAANGGRPPLDAADLRLVRPLLELTRQEIDAYCTEHRLSPRQDITNQDTSILRNRLRHELLPLLEQYNPNIRSVVRHTGEVVGADIELMDGIVKQTWDQVTLQADNNTVIFDLTFLRALPRALQRSLIRRSVSYLDHTLRDVTFAQVENALNVVNNGITGKIAVLPGGITLHLVYRQAILTTWPSLRIGAYWPRFSLSQPVEIPMPGSYVNKQDGWRLECHLVQRAALVDLEQTHSYRIFLAREAVNGPLQLGTRRPGDRMQPLGMQGQTQKLHDLMINAKVPSCQRRYVPVLRLGDQIVWVAGLRQDNRFAIADTTVEVISLQFRPLEEY